MPYGDQAPSTEEWWDVNGTSLHQYGWSVATFGGSRYDLPPRRGANLTTAYRPGQIHRNKLADARQINLLMWLTSMDPATGKLLEPNQRLRFNDSWDFLRRLVWKTNGTQVKLTRRWRLSPPAFPATSADLDVPALTDAGVPSPGSRVLVATADAEMVGTMAPTMTGRFRADFTMDFLLADPYFYGDEVTVQVNRGSTKRVWNDGHDTAAHNHLEIDFVGPITNPAVINLSTDPVTTIKLNNLVLDEGDSVRVNVGDYTVTRLTGDSTTSLIGKVIHSGARHWMGLKPGNNKILVDSQFSGEDGHAILRFRPPYV